MELAALLASTFAKERWFWGATAAIVSFLLQRERSARESSGASRAGASASAAPPGIVHQPSLPS
ncbi:MAG TPA: hypothetical protein VLD13_07135 [Gaiellaceae bacterium]|nr:hypothetical protein [Gaiellaceae bacterium]